MMLWVRREGAGNGDETDVLRHPSLAMDSIDRSIEEEEEEEEVPKRDGID